MSHGVCRSQTQLRSHIAMAVAQGNGYSSDLIPSLGTSICCWFGPKNPKNKTKQNKKQTNKQKKQGRKKQNLFYGQMRQAG